MKLRFFSLEDISSPLAPEICVDYFVFFASRKDLKKI